MITFIFFILFIALPFLCAAQLTPGHVLRVQSDGVHFELVKEYFTPDDTSHGPNLKIMTRWVADSSIAVLNSTIAGKLATAAFTVAAVSALYGYTPANAATVATNTADIATKLNKADTAAMLANYISGINTNTANIVLKLNKSDTAAMLSPYLRSNIAAATYQAAGSYVTTSRTISTTSPITGGGDLSANRTIAINNAAADGSTKGAATFATEYFDDNGSGVINLAFLNGTGSVSANAVTINATKGTITYTSPSITAGNAITVTFTNSYITSTSNINLILNSNGSNFATNVQLYIKSKSAGSCTFNVANLSLLSLFNSTFLIDFAVIN